MKVLIYPLTFMTCFLHKSLYLLLSVFKVFTRNILPTNLQNVTRVTPMFAKTSFLFMFLFICVPLNLENSFEESCFGH